VPVEALDRLAHLELRREPIMGIAAESEVVGNLLRSDADALKLPVFAVAPFLIWDVVPVQVGSQSNSAF